MSAGGLSYSGLQTKRRVTLPSVDMWGTSMNILKDPNVGVFTRRKDKVGDTQNILLEQDDSGDRAAEYIRVYARGVNPMVSVSYDNSGSNGGQSMSGGGCLGGNGALASVYGQQSRLPYQIETFRPPILRQEDLMPLSRMPRVWYHAETNPQFPDFLQERECLQISKSTKSPDQILRTPADQDRCGDTRGGFEVTSHPEHNSANISRDPLRISNDGVVRTGYESGTQVPDYTEGYSRDLLRRTHDGSLMIGPDRVFREDDSDKPSGGIFLDPLHASAQTALTRGDQNATTEQYRDKQGAKEIDRNRRIYEAFSNKSMPVQGNDYQTDAGAADPQQRAKSINSNLLYMQAQTNNRGPVERSMDPNEVTGNHSQASKPNPTITIEGFQIFPSADPGIANQVGQDSTVIPTKRMVYASAQTSQSSNFRTRDAIEDGRDASQSAAVVSETDMFRVGNVMSNANDPTRRENVPHQYLGEGTIEQQPLRVSGETTRTMNRQEAGQAGSLRIGEHVHTDIMHIRAEAPISRSAADAGLTESEQSRLLQGTVVPQRMQFSTQTQAILPGADLGSSVMFFEKSAETTRSLPSYSAYTASTGGNKEAERANLPQLDRRTMMVQDMTTAPENAGRMAHTDMYQNENQTRTAKGGISQRPSLGGFLHNASARPMPTSQNGYASLSQDLYESSQGHTQKQSTTNDRVNLRRRAFDEFMGRNYAPPPPEYMV